MPVARSVIDDSGAVCRFRNLDKAAPNYEETPLR
jgi:hypothetical protein